MLARAVAAGVVVSVCWTWVNAREQNAVQTRPATRPDSTWVRGQSTCPVTRHTTKLRLAKRDSPLRNPGNHTAAFPVRLPPQHAPQLFKAMPECVVLSGDGNPRREPFS